MTRNMLKRGGRIARLLALSAAVGLSSAIADSARPDEPSKSKPAATRTAQGSRALGEIAKASDRRESVAPKPEALPGGLSKRPDKTIVPMTIDAKAIDALIDRTLVAAKVAPARVCSDEEFVRRVCLDVTGRLPAPDQIASFCRSTDRDKRSRLIDALLQSSDYARNWARYWRDVIRYRATNENLGQVRFPLLEDWFAEKFEQNVPWDEIASELLTATGRNDENGATVFAVAHQGQDLAVEMAGEVSRIFLGIQIQCAQCHDHPNDPWKRRQFHEFAAFFAGVNVRRFGKQVQGRIPPFEVIEVRRPPRYAMPDLKDPLKKIPVAPKFFLTTSEDSIPANLNAGRRRALAAAYVTAQDNPWFARAFVNRIWSALLGDGFYNPVDDLGPTRTARDFEVLDALATQWQAAGYDVRELFRLILNTRAYQREFRSTDTKAGIVPFAANNPGRLRADPLIDALHQALNVPVEGRISKEDLGGKGAAKKVEAREFLRRQGPRIQFNAIFGVDPSIPNDDLLGTIPQSLFLMNAPQVNRAIESRPGTVLGEILSRHPDNRSALLALYLRVLARRPSPKEIEVCERHLIELRGDRRTCFEDILWCLINSTEFVTRR